MNKNIANIKASVRCIPSEFAERNIAYSNLATMPAIAEAATSSSQNGLVFLPTIELRSLQWKNVLRCVFDTEGTIQKLIRTRTIFKKKAQRSWRTRNWCFPCILHTYIPTVIR